MGTKIIYVGPDGKPLGKKKRKHPPKRATQPTPQANRTWGDRRMDRANFPQSHLPRLGLG